MTQESEVKPGSLWNKNSNKRHVAKVLWVGDGYLRFEANWSKTGILGKCTDSFLAHYKPVQPNA